MLTAADDRENVATAVANGATGYLHKDVSREELCAAVANALDGHDLLEPSLRRAMSEQRIGARVADPGAALTERELQVLRGMSQGKSNAEIGRSLFLSEDTVKTHARRLFRKLGVSDRAQAVACGFRRGFVDLKPDGTFEWERSALARPTASAVLAGTSDSSMSSSSSSAASSTPSE